MHKLLLRNALGNMQTSQEYFKTTVYAKFGGANEVHYGQLKNSEYSEKVSEEKLEQEQPPDGQSRHQPTSGTEDLIAFSRNERTYPNLVSQASQAREIEIFVDCKLAAPLDFCRGIGPRFSVDPSRHACSLL